MNRRDFLKGIGISGASVVLGGCGDFSKTFKSNSPGRKPNIVFILADDLGWHQLGCFGSTFYETPNLDGFARQGMRFTDAYAAAAVCSPTRASIMTGKYPARLHLTDFIKGGSPKDKKLLTPEWTPYLPLEEVTIAEVFKREGYATGFVGKWHLAPPDSKRRADFYPDRQGFDINIGGNHQAAAPSHFDPYRLQNLPNRKEGEYLADRLTDEALTFLEQHKDKPFFSGLVDYISSAPIVAAVFEGEEAIAAIRKTVGSTDPAKAEPGTIRADFGLDVQQNVVHGSDSIETAEKEIKLFFAGDEIFDY